MRTRKNATILGITIIALICASYYTYKQYHTTATPDKNAQPPTNTKPENTQTNRTATPIAEPTEYWGMTGTGTESDKCFDQEKHEYTLEELEKACKCSCKRKFLKHKLQNTNTPEIKHCHCER